MNVAALQSFLKNLANTLEQADGRTVAKELEHVCHGLEPFRELRVKDFADFLVRAEQYTRDPNLLEMGRRRGRPPAQPLDPEKVRKAALAVRSLEDRATDDSVSMPAIKAQLDQLGQTLTGEEAVEVAKEVGITTEGRMTKAAALRQIRQRIEERKRPVTPATPTTASAGVQGACVTANPMGSEPGTVIQPQ
jgi:hypothetical protein